MKSDEMARYDEEDTWSYGQKFAYEWVYAILTDEKEYKNILTSLENK